MVRRVERVKGVGVVLVSPKRAIFSNRFV
jgi:hypothetical protein